MCVTYVGSRLVLRDSTAVPGLNLVLHLCPKHHSKSVDVRYDALDLEVMRDALLVLITAERYNVTAVLTAVLLPDQVTSECTRLHTNFYDAHMLVTW
jgi:hypothetical protein